MTSSIHWSLIFLSCFAEFLCESVHLSFPGIFMFILVCKGRKSNLCLFPVAAYAIVFCSFFYEPELFMSQVARSGAAAARKWPMKLGRSARPKGKKCR